MTEEWRASSIGFDVPALKWSGAIERWVEGIPLGNGHLGVCFLPGETGARLLLNEETIWAGPPNPQDRAGAGRAVGRVRELLFAGEYAKADKLAAKALMGEPLRPRSYQPAGWLEISWQGKATAIESRLDLASGVLDVVFRGAAGHFRLRTAVLRDTRTILVSAHAEKDGVLPDCQIQLSREEGARAGVSPQGDLWMEGRASHGRTKLGVRFRVDARVRGLGDRTVATGNRLALKGGRGWDLNLTVATDYLPSRGIVPGRDLAKITNRELNTVGRQSAARLFAAHQRVHRRQFLKSTIALAGDSAQIDLAGEIEAARNGQPIPPATEVALFGVARYLLMASSQPGGTPANLQGIWNGLFKAAWDSDYHLNINIQMNYWISGPGQLPECERPLFDFLRRLLPNARKTARNLGAHGAAAGHFTDLWLNTTPAGLPKYGMWLMGFAWCAFHAVEHYRFTADTRFLKQTGWPLMREAALFCLDWLHPHPVTGELVSGPSHSPENSFLTKAGESVSGCMGPTFDHLLIRELFAGCLEALEVLGGDDKLKAKLEDALRRLAPVRLNQFNGIREWYDDEVEAEPGHRHLTPVFSLYPGREFTPAFNPELARASRATLDRRVAHGCGSHNWTRAWMAGLFARLGEGDRAADWLAGLLRERTLPNFFTLCPPFTIEATFGAGAAVAEMLLQSHGPTVQLLPACPERWPSGQVRGLAARPGLVIDFDWGQGRVTRCRVKSRASGSRAFEINGKQQTVNLAAGKWTTVRIPSQTKKHTK